MTTPTRTDRPPAPDAPAAAGRAPLVHGGSRRQPPSRSSPPGDAPPQRQRPQDAITPPLWKRYGLAAAATFIAFGCAALLDAYGVERGQFAVIVVAAVAATAYGGPSAGVCASLLGIALLDFVIIGPRFRFGLSGQDLTALAVLSLTTLIAGAIYEAARRGQQHAEELAADLEQLADTLRVSETRWRQVAEALPAKMGEAAADGTPTFFNQLWADYTGLSADELASSWEEIVHPDDLARVIAIREHSLPLGEPYRMEWRARDRDRTYRWHLTSVSPVKDPSGRIVSWISAAVDIEDLKRGEQLLRNQANLLDQTHDAVLVWDFDDGSIRYWNAAAEALYGYRADEARGRVPHELLAAVHESPLELIEHQLESTGTWDGIIAQTASDDRRLKVESRRVLVTQSDGRRVVLETNRDVSARIRADEALRLSEARWRQLTGAMPAIIAEAAPDGRMTYYNERALEYTGCSLGELLDHGWRKIVHPDDLQDAAERWQAAATSGEPVTYEQRLRRHDGAYRWHLGYGVPMRSAEGAITSWLDVNVDIDDRRRVEEELRSSQDHFRSLVAAVPANVFLNAPDGSTLFANDRWLSYVGLSFDEAMAGARYSEAVHPEDRAAVASQWALAAADGQPQRMEFRIRRQDGVYRWHVSDSLPLRDESGAITMWLTVSIDMDDQKRAHDEIRQSEERMRESVTRYEALIAAAPSFVFLADASGTVTWNSGGYYEYIGLAPDEVADWRWLDEEVLHADDLRGLAESWARSIAAGEAFELEVRLRGQDGVYRWHLNRIVPTRDAEGAITGWVGTSTNIDERRRAEEALRASEQRTRAIVETAVDGIITIDDRGTIESWNPAAARIFGYAVDEVLGQNVRMLMPSPDHERHDSYIGDYLRTGDAKIIGIGREVTGRRKDGTTFPMELAISDVLIEGRHLFTGLVRDVTDRRRAEDALRSSEERFRLAAAASRIGAWEWDLGTTVRWSESMEEIYGFEPGGYPGTFEAFIAHVHPDDRDATMRAINEALASGEELDFEHRIVLPDGGTRWLNGRGRLLRDTAGRPLRMAGIGMDITERKFAQQELALAEERLRLATEGAEFGMWDWHRDDDRTYCSEREFELFGIEPKETVTSGELMARVHPDDRDQVTAQLRDTVERSATCELEFRVVHPDESVRWLAGWAMGVSDFSGVASRVIGLNVDITARKRQDRDREFLAELGNALQQSLDHEVLVAQIVRSTVTGFAQYCALYLLEGDEVRRIAAGAAAPGELDVSVHPLGSRESIPVARALTKGRETLLTSIDEDMLRAGSSSESQMDNFRQIGLSSAIVVPLRSGGRVTGALSLATSSDHPAFDDADMETAREIARRVTLALENARMYEQTERDRVRAATLAELSALLGQSLDYETTLQNAAAVSVPALSDWCAIDLVDERGDPRRVAIAHPDPERVRQAREAATRWPAVSSGIIREHGFWYVVKHGASDLIEHISEEMLERAVPDDEQLRLAKSLGLRSSLCVPLIARSRVLGAITLVMAESGRSFRQEDIPYFEEVARRAALAIDSAELYSAEQAAQADLSDRVAELETLLENVPVGICIAHDRACTRITSNREFGRILRAPADVAQTAPRNEGAPWFRVMREDAEVPEEDLPLQRAAATGTPVLGDSLEFVFDDGSPSIKVYGSALPLYDAEGSARGAIGVLMDITDRLHAEDELRHALAAKDDFLGMVSHELKTPITMVRGNAEILLRRSSGLDEATRRQSLADILNDAERLQSIIENLLFLARLEHVPALPAEPLFVSRVVERIVADCQRRSEGRELQLIDRSIASVAVAEPTYIDQVLRNLLSNAIKYSPPHQPVEIIVDDDDTSIAVSVLDRGPGVPEEEAELIFTPFFRSERTSARAHGVGIGLAVCKRLIEAQGGRMWCRAREGGGAEVGFSLPRAKEEA